MRTVTLTVKQLFSAKTPQNTKKQAQSDRKFNLNKFWWRNWDAKMPGSCSKLRIYEILWPPSGKRNYLFQSLFQLFQFCSKFFERVSIVSIVPICFNWQRWTATRRRKDDTQNREAFHIFLLFSNLNWKTLITDHIIIQLNWPQPEMLIGEIRHFYVALYII